MFMTESWLKNEEEERKRAVEEASRKTQEADSLLKNVEAEIKKIRKGKFEINRISKIPTYY